VALLASMQLLERVYVCRRRDAQVDAMVAIAPRRLAANAVSISPRLVGAVGLTAIKREVALAR
jgi:hypothetical protein